MENQNPIKNTDEFIKKILESKKKEKFDLSADEDLSLALMNLISMEEHFFFSGVKSKDEKYFELLDQTRKMRIELMKKIERNPTYEDHCLMKHLLAASMRLMEVGTKKLSEGKKEEAYDLFEKSYNLYSLFWGINLKLVKTGDIKKIDDNALNKHDTEKKNLPNGRQDLPAGRQGFMGKLGELVRKIIDCCIE
jgi:hypothetical protein